MLDYGYFHAKEYLDENYFLTKISDLYCEIPNYVDAEGYLVDFDFFFNDGTVLQVKAPTGKASSALIKMLPFFQQLPSYSEKILDIFMDSEMQARAFAEWRRQQIVSQESIGQELKKAVLKFLNA